MDEFTVRSMDARSMVSDPLTLPKPAGDTPSSTFLFSTPHPPAPPGKLPIFVPLDFLPAAVGSPLISFIVANAAYHTYSHCLH